MDTKLFGSSGMRGLVNEDLTSALAARIGACARKTLAELVSETPKYATLRENVSVTNTEKYRVVMRAAEKTKFAFPQYKKISMVDGFRLMLHNGWILIRASGTEPLVRLTVEGESLKTARAIMQKGIQAVKNSEGRCSC